MKKLAAAVAILLIFAAAALCAAAGNFIASRDREPFHTLNCSWAKKISPENAVYYNTRDEAVKDGHRPCKVCRP